MPLSDSNARQRLTRKFKKALGLSCIETKTIDSKNPVVIGDQACRIPATGCVKALLTIDKPEFNSSNGEPVYNTYSGSAIEDCHSFDGLYIEVGAVDPETKTRSVKYPTRRPRGPGLQGYVEGHYTLTMSADLSEQACSRGPEGCINDNGLPQNLLMTLSKDSDGAQFQKMFHGLHPTPKRVPNVSDRADRQTMEADFLLYTNRRFKYIPSLKSNTSGTEDLTPGCFGSTRCSKAATWLKKAFRGTTESHASNEKQQSNPWRGRSKTEVFSEEKQRLLGQQSD